MNLPNYIRKKRGKVELKKGKKWITWNPYHSKLAAYLLGNGENWPFTRESKVLYLGAAEGNTVNFLSNVCIKGRIIAVDISRMSMIELVKLADEKRNIIPFLGDAHFPEKYKNYAGNPDVLYQDIAQTDQINIFIRNCEYFKPKYGFLMIKSHSISGKESEIYSETEKLLKEKFDAFEVINISKWAKGHRAYYIE
tara:strand:+ start:98 stop:682 length:585 start_codon:yes stop_codon:yes gene_type:complete